LGITTELHNGDSKEKLKLISDNSVDLIITSPPLMQIKEKIYTAVLLVLNLFLITQMVVLLS